jgi:hypothetical protein
MALAAELPDRAVAHGRAAVGFCERAGYFPEFAWSACDLAAALAVRGAAGDEEEAAAALRERAQLIALEIGMRPLLARLAFAV